MCLDAVRDLVTRTRHEPKRAAVAQLRLELALEAEEDVSFLAPVIRAITRRVFNHADTHEAELARAPARDACFSSVLGDLEGVPVGSAKGNVVKLHLRMVEEGDSAEASIALADFSLRERGSD
jgi:hypothetical protein